VCGFGSADSDSDERRRGLLAFFIGEPFAFPILTFLLFLFFK
jgi:hypothetical protein